MLVLQGGAEQSAPFLWLDLTFLRESIIVRLSFPRKGGRVISYCGYGSFFMATPYKPTWAAYEKDTHDQHDANKAIKASDMFIEERDKELKTSQKAREWEKGRRESIAKQKPAYVKQRIKSEEEKKIAPLKKIKQLGSFDNSIKPMPGFIIVELNEKETTTDAGIILAAQDAEPNTGLVVEISDPLTVVTQTSVEQVPCPVKIGDKILFKRYAGAMGSPGASLSINDKDFRLMRWNPNPIESDILGVFYE